MALPECHLASIGILTSGGDSQGMNCVLFGLLKSALHFTDVYLIREGYAGLLTGGPAFIQKGNVELLQKYLHQGGTIIGSSRCLEFRSPEGRKKAARNLLELNIHNLVVVGGDGSLTGANMLRHEWPDIVAQWRRDKGLEQAPSPSKLNIVGIIGSIDNDFLGTEMTIGTDSALFRIVEAIDTLLTTAASHHRAMVIEVMGRNCGYLALSSALATEATYVFAPECPHSSTSDWQDKLRARILFERAHNQQYHFIIVAEGACDQNGTPVKATFIRDFLGNEFNIDTRVVCLGHTQRGGNTSAFDRLMSIQMGIEAFQVLRQQSATSEQDSPASVLTINEGQIRKKPLMSCVQETTKLGSLMKDKKWSEVMKLRGSHFGNTWKNYRELMSNSEVNENERKQKPFWAIAHLGDPVPGMNGVLYALVRYAYARNFRVLAAKNGLEGLVKDEFEEMQRQSMSGLTTLSGSVIGSVGKQQVPNSDKRMETIVEHLKRRQVTCLCLVGDETAFELAKQFHSQATTVKVCFIPACVQPKGELLMSHFKLGFDSILNKTCQQLSDLMLSSQGSLNRLFVIKLNLAITSSDFVQPSLFALANSAMYSYPTSKTLLGSSQIDVGQVQREATYLKEKMMADHLNQMVLVHDSLFSKVWDIYRAVFGSQVAPEVIDLTRLQMPMTPSPFDRKLAVKLGMRCAQHFLDPNANASPVLLTWPLFDVVPIQ